MISTHFCVDCQQMNMMWFFNLEGMMWSLRVRKPGLNKQRGKRVDPDVLFVKMIF